MRPGLVALLLTWSSLGLAGAPARDAGAALRQAQPAAEELLPLTLPDLSGLHPSVEKQLREAHASISKKLEGAGGSPDTHAEAFGEMGKLFMATRFNDEAERSFRNAERLGPNDFRWPYYLGHVLRNAGDLPGAAESFERVRQLRPTDFATLVWLGRVYLDLSRPAEAEARLNEARVLNPRQPAARV